MLPLIKPDPDFNEVLADDVLVTAPLDPATALVLTIVLDTVLATEIDVRGALLQEKKKKHTNSI